MPMFWILIHKHTDIRLMNLTFMYFGSIYSLGQLIKRILLSCGSDNVKAHTKPRLNLVNT